MLTPILIGVAVLLVLLAMFVATRPKTFRIARTIAMAAPADIPFGYVNDFHKWASWSPFERLDPTMKKTYSGAPSGEGAGYAWTGNNKAGTGTMQLRKSVPVRSISIDLAFEKPFKATNVSEFEFERTPGGTDVTWAVTGENTTTSKLFSLFMNMDKMLGAQFEEGLALLKAVSEADAARTNAVPAPTAAGFASTNR